MHSSGRYREVNPGGLSHSEIHGSAPACGSPWLIATCYVLLRLLAPRHSPFALSSLITKFDLSSDFQACCQVRKLPKGNSANCNICPILSFYLYAYV